MTHDSFEAALAEQRRQEEAYYMQIEATQAEYVDLIRGMSVEQLVTMRKMLVACHDKLQRGTLVGMVTGALTLVHGRTWEGKDPMEALFRDEKPTAKEAIKEAEQDDKPWAPTVEQSQQADRYEVEWNPDPNFPNQWRCKNCEQPVSSLEDRMLKPPGIEGCPTCQHKMKWG